MAELFYALILLLLALAGVMARKTYYQLPPHELKRQSEKHPGSSQAKLYGAVAYGTSLRVLLWFFITLTTAGSAVILAREVAWAPGLLAVVLVLWVAFSWLPSSKVSGLSLRLTLLVTPLLTWLLNYLHPLLSRGAGAVEKRYSAPRHTGIFEREDLLRLIDEQQAQADSRLRPEELQIARRALSFDDYTVADVLTPRKQIKTVRADDTVGPVLIDELHKTGEEYVLVRDGAGKAKDPFVGTLPIRNLGLETSGHVRDVMDSRVYYVHENDALSEALHAFFSTNHPLFVVVNSFEEYVGIITVENILRQLLGHVPGDDFDQYANITAVAARHPKPKK